jgi:hypothetical protein
VVDVHSAIHIRTGQKSVVKRVDDWLAAHDVGCVTFDDVYGACVYLLRHYDRIPDLVLVGADWLARDEYNIVSYVRQTWPRVGVVVYGSAGSTPLFDLLPLMIACDSAAALEQLLAESPGAVVRRMLASVSPGELAAASGAPPAPQQPLGVGPLPPPRGAVEESAAPASSELRVAPTEPPRSILSAEELSALLDASDDE